MFWRKAKKKNILEEPTLLETILNSILVREIEQDKMWCIELNNKNSISSINFVILDIMYHFDGDETSFIHIIPTLKVLNIIYDYLVKHKFINTSDKFSFYNFEKYVETIDVEIFDNYSIYNYRVGDRKFKFKLQYNNDEEIKDEINNLPGLLLFVELIERS